MSVESGDYTNYGVMSVMTVFANNLLTGRVTV